MASVLQKFELPQLGNISDIAKTSQNGSIAGSSSVGKRPWIFEVADQSKEVGGYLSALSKAASGTMNIASNQSANSDTSTGWNPDREQQAAARNRKSAGEAAATVIGIVISLLSIL